jgi:Cdc6-like AAA superfamily ATPase
MESIISLLSGAETMVYKLILLVSPSGSGKTVILREVSRREDIPYVNVNLELSRKLLGVEVKQRYRKAQRLLEEIIESRAPLVIVLDNIEMLFEPSLRLDVLGCLKQLSRRRVVVAAWNGVYENSLTYASPEHAREFRRFSVDHDVLIVT